MKKHASIICVFLLSGIFLLPQTLTHKPEVKKLIISPKIWVKVLCMNKWDDGKVTNTAIVELKEKTPSGPVINNAKVTVNGQILSFKIGIQGYMGNIGTLSQGQKVPIDIKTGDGRNISGYVQATYFVVITSPAPFTRVSVFNKIPVKWKFSNSSIYQIVFKILKGETQLFSTDVNGSSYIINLKVLGLKIPPARVIRARVISPWTENYNFTGPFAPGSRGQFFTSATVSIQLNK